MPFNIEAFTAARMRPRTKIIPFPQGAEFFGPGEPLEIEVHGLTGEEMAQVGAMVQLNANIPQMIREGRNAGESAQELVNTVLMAIAGIKKQMSNEYVMRLHTFRFGFDGFDEELAKKFGMSYPTQLGQIASEILELTGQGHVTEGK